VRAREARTCSSDSGADSGAPVLPSIGHVSLIPAAARPRCCRPTRRASARAGRPSATHLPYRARRRARNRFGSNGDPE
jgi:hypothetical protein